MSDALIGFYLQSFHRSIRKRQRESPKFYLFDMGVRRALANTLNLPLDPSTFEYGNTFEHLLILECHRLNSYLERDFKFSYLRTKDDAEIDLVIERPGQADLLVEIKSYLEIEDSDITKLVAFVQSWDRPVEAMILSRHAGNLLVRGVQCLEWKSALPSIKKITKN